jgi:outer membrane lipoprotein-sorting protein
MRARLFGVVLILAAAGAVAQEKTTSTGLDADALLVRLDHNQTSLSGHALGSITVQDRFGTKSTDFESWSQGSDRSLVVFTSGDEKGQKILRLGDTIYVAYPDADKPVKIQGAALRDSVAGSDFSYEDMAGDTSVASRYSASLAGEETVNGELCGILDLTAKKPGLSYPILRVWVSLKDFTGRKTEKYSQNRRLLKTEEVLQTTVVAGRTVATKAEMADAIKVKSKTLFLLSRIELDIKVPASKLSLEELTW